ncbi:MAG: hypothetical protein ACI8RZ_000114 [Myxococcota bacterium]
MSLSELPEPDVLIHVHTAAGRTELSRRQIRDQLADGQVARTDLFWFSGMDGWAPISDHPELTNLPEVAEPEPEPAAPVVPEPVALVAVPDRDSHRESDLSDDELDAVFGSLIQESWAYHSDHSFASHIDEVMVGALITDGVRRGLSLIDLSSDGTNHYMRFEKIGEGSRVIIRLTHLTGNMTTAATQGHRVAAVIGYGEKLKDFSRVWSAIKAEYKSGLVSRDTPGAISVDGDLSSQYVYVQIRLFLKVDDYVARDYTIDYHRLDEHLDATLNALRKYLRGRFS